VGAKPERKAVNQALALPRHSCSRDAISATGEMTALIRQGAAPCDFARRLSRATTDSVGAAVRRPSIRRLSAPLMIGKGPVGKQGDALSISTRESLRPRLQAWPHAAEQSLGTPSSTFASAGTAHNEVRSDFREHLRYADQGRARPPAARAESSVRLGKSRTWAR